MTLHIVKAKVVKVTVGAVGGNAIAHIIRRGGIVPEGVAPDKLQHLLDRGLIEPLIEEEAADETPPEPEVVSIPDGDPVEGWTVKQLKAYAEREGKDLGEAKVKADILTALAVAVEPAPAS